MSGIFSSYACPEGLSSCGQCASFLKMLNEACVCVCECVCVDVCWRRGDSRKTKCARCCIRIEDERAMQGEETSEYTASSSWVLWSIQHMPDVTSRRWKQMLVPSTSGSVSPPRQTRDRLGSRRWGLLPDLSASSNVTSLPLRVRQWQSLSWYAVALVL